MNTTPILRFPDWAPLPVVDEAKRLFANISAQTDQAKATEVLKRLTSDPDMKRAWAELYKKKRFNNEPTDDFLHPACVKDTAVATKHEEQARRLRKKGGAINERDANLLDAEAAILRSERELESTEWSDQDLAAQFILRHAFWAALYSRPVFKSDLMACKQELRSIADRLRTGAENLRFFKEDKKDLFAARLDEIASDCEQEALNVLPERVSDGGIYSPQADDPWIVERRIGDVNLAAFVVDVAGRVRDMFGKTLNGTIATVANVALGRKDVRGQTVREILRNRGFEQ